MRLDMSMKIIDCDASECLSQEVILLLPSLPCPVIMFSLRDATKCTNLLYWPVQLTYY